MRDCDRNPNGDIASRDRDRSLSVPHRRDNTFRADTHDVRCIRTERGFSRQIDRPSAAFPRYDELLGGITAVESKL